MERRWEKKVRKILAGLGILSLVLGVAGPVLAVTPTPVIGTVTATVTPQIIAVTVEDGDVDYGYLDISETNNTFDGASPALGDDQTITSGSNVSTDIALRSSDAYVTPNTTSWDLVGTAAPDDFVHSYDIDVGEGSADWAAFPFDGTFDNTYTSSVVTLASFGNTATLDLKIDMPTSISNILVRNITVTVLATET